MVLRDNNFQACHFLQGDFHKWVPFCICLWWVSVSKYNLNHQHEYNQLGQSLGGALCMAWRPSPATLMKDLFCLWIGPFFCPERKKGALTLHCTIDNYRIVLNCYFFLRHKRLIRVFILAEDRLSCLWSSQDCLDVISQNGLMQASSTAWSGDYISWKRKAFLHLAQSNVPFTRRHSLKTHGHPQRTCLDSQVPHSLGEGPRLQCRKHKETNTREEKLKMRSLRV